MDGIIDFQNKVQGCSRVDQMECVAGKTSNGLN